jgi:DNA-binding NarL/FixJ family response regulator
VSDQEPIRVLIADDLTLVREGFVEIVRAEPGMSVVGEVGDGLAAVEFYRRLRPDVLLLDLRMPGLNGIEVLETIRAFDPRARVIILTVSECDYDIYCCLQAGASGYLLKGMERAVLISAIHEVYRGALVIPNQVASRMATHLTSKHLTNREVQVLRLIGDGKANKEIAFDLGIGEGTVKTHVANILGKLDCWSRLEAVSIAYRRGLLWQHVVFLFVQLDGCMYVS